MQPVLVQDKESLLSLYPFTQVRIVADFLSGMFSIRRKWENIYNCLVPVIDETEQEEWAEKNNRLFFIPANLIPGNLTESDKVELARSGSRSIPDSCRMLQKPWQLAAWNDWSLRNDFRISTSGRQSSAIPAHVQVTGETGQVFLEEGVRLEPCFISVSEGPIYISRNSLVMAGAMLRGPLYIGENSVVKMGATLYGGTSVGKNCIVGGEIKNSVIGDYSNKAHHGYLGDAVIGEWCNLGAGTSCSNVKNTAAPVKVWDRTLGTFTEAGLKCGLLMGDFSRSAINTSFNTGTVTGVSCNIFQDSGLTPTYIADFSWGMHGPYTYQIDKAIQDISRWMELKGEKMPSSLSQKLLQLHKTQNQSI
jgi:UDP-N-acetylglucosamine diphosphorylase/glucosamine-1-phosphate N-acetyltransferase